MTDRFRLAPFSRAGLLGSLPPDLARERAPSRLGGALYLLALVAIAFYDLAGRSIFHRDVTRFATIAGEMLRSGDWLVPTQYGVTYANKPILYIWCVAAASALSGEVSAFTLRLPSALALVATGWATWLWGRARSGSLAVGRVAGLVAVTTYSLHELGRTGRPDMLATAFATIAAALVDRALLARASPRAWLSIGFALGGGFLSKGPVVLLIPAALLFLPRAGTTLRARHRLVRLDLALAVGIGLAALWIVPAGFHGGWDYVKRLVFDQVGDRVRGEGNHREAVWHYLVTAPLAWQPWTPALFGAAIFAATKRGRALFGSSGHVGAALVAFVVLSLVPTKEIRYAAILVPPLAVAAAQLSLAWMRAGSGDDAPSRARIHLVLAGVAALLATAGIVAAELTWVTTAPWLTPIALLVFAVGAGATRLGASPATSSRDIRSRVGGLLVVLAACGTCAYWVVLGRYLVVHTAEAENRALAGVIDPGLPVVLVGALEMDGLNPDDVVGGAPVVRFVRSVGELDAASLPADVQLIALGRDRDAIESRVGPMRRVFDRPRAGGGFLVVLRRAP